MERHSRNHTQINPVKTYANVANVHKAVEKAIPEIGKTDLRYSVMTSEDGRYYPLFIGMNSFHHGVHFKFNCVA